MLEKVKLNNIERETKSLYAGQNLWHVQFSGWRGIFCLSGITLDSSDYLFRQIAFRKGKKWLVGDKPVSYSAARSSILGD